VIKKGDYVVFESTVYPGCTEEDCLPIIEKLSGLKNVIDFKSGYSPERINPGDKKHTIRTIIKVVSGCDAESLEEIAKTYELVVDAGVHKASSIKVAEAAKIIENTQRDLNIALMNELSIIFDKMNINTFEVLEAAGTKWNFCEIQSGPRRRPLHWRRSVLPDL
jgi:UDP-N-acetyl-D-galactosamine dehydrogenase